jgi:hypothetical protein
MSNDKDIEAMIQAKGKTAARITPQMIEDNIVSEQFFTAMDGATNSSLHGADFPEALRLLTFCVLVMKNGFMVTGESACASPENFDADIGKKIARGNAVQKIWGLMGYELRSKLSQEA